MTYVRKMINGKSTVLKFMLSISNAPRGYGGNRKSISIPFFTRIVATGLILWGSADTIKKWIALISRF